MSTFRHDARHQRRRQADAEVPRLRRPLLQRVQPGQEEREPSPQPLRTHGLVRNPRFESLLLVFIFLMLVPEKLSDFKTGLPSSPQYLMVIGSLEIGA